MSVLVAEEPCRVCGLRPNQALTHCADCGAELPTRRPSVAAQQSAFQWGGRATPSQQGRVTGEVARSGMSTSQQPPASTKANPAATRSDLNRRLRTTALIAIPSMMVAGLLALGVASARPVQPYSSARIEADLEQSISQASGTGEKWSVNCPNTMNPRMGTTTVCQATDSLTRFAGPVAVEVTWKDDQGNSTWAWK